MKRSSNGDAAEAHHPALAFHREVLIIQQWTKIRREFLQALEAVAASRVVQWREPRKLWRHAQEALGKWILSQVARVHLPARDEPHNDPSRGTPSAAHLREAEIRFFPSADQLRYAMANARGAHASSAAATGSSAIKGKQDLRTYDEQLVRDLSIKSNGTHDSAAVAALVQLVKNFSLAKRCVAAAEAIEAGMQGVTPAQALKPRIRRLEADDPQRTPQQQRIAGPIAEVSVQWPRHWRREQCRDCPPVSLPWAAMEKLRMCYDFFSEASEQARYDKGVFSADAHQLRFQRRASTVILRYEGGLATGSLQLCADTQLKQHLHAAGYHVMDLCASPINAYMKTPQPGTFRSAASDSDGAVAEEVPNHFCSAFYDTDQYFGSIGSAVAVDPQRIYSDAVINPDGKPLLLTLDVPYDEDICELLFQKLVRDMRSAMSGTGAAAAVVDYVLVLPLWWDLRLQIEKRFFGGPGGVTKSSSSSSPSAGPLDVAQLVQRRAAMLQEGYRVPYSWPEALAAAAGDARTPTAAAAAAPDAWVCFDGVFIDDDYGYFCTATNKWLHGVTATEVIGLAQPRASPQLKQALDSFYAVPTASPPST